MERKIVRSQRTRTQHFTKLSVLFIFLTIIVSSSAFGFYAPLTNYTVTYNATDTQLKLSVYDPYRGTTVESDWIATYESVDDDDFKQSNGVASWLSASDELTVAVYDPARSTPWRTHTIEDVANATHHHTNANGIVGVYVGTATKSGVEIRIYRALTGVFDCPFFTTNSNVTITFGKCIMVVAWITTNSLPYNMGALAYNVRDHTTRTKNFPPTATAIENLAIDICDTVTFTHGSDSYYWAYNYSDNSWQQGINTVISTTPMACIVPEQTVSGSPSPENVWWFFDYSIANTSSLITFGDNTSSTERSPGHPYVTNGPFTVQQTVSGCGGNDSDSTDISFSITNPPTGSISISDTDPTYDNTVNLVLNYSTSYVDQMRLKNENDSTWGAWQTAAGTYSDWELSSGYGTKTVYAQFFDDTRDYITQESSDQINYYPAIAVTYPNGGDYLKQGKAYDVTWTYAGSNAVRVELWNKGSYQTTLASSVSSGTTSLNCTIPVNHTTSSNWIGANYKVRVIDTVYSHYDESDSDFHIGDIWITAPNGSESLTLGDPTDIQFTAKEVPGDPIKVTLWKNSVKVGAIKENITLTTSAHSFPWASIGDLVDNSGCTGINDEIEELGTDFQIQARVGTTAFKDLSDSNFTIKGIRVSAPNGNYCDSGVVQTQTLTNGTSYSITWDSLSPPTGNIKITLLQNGGEVAVLGTDLTNNGSFAWTVGEDKDESSYTPSTGSGFTIKVEVLSQGVSDVSDNSFTIVDP